ncbi:MAG: ABC transporter permease subunit [Chloroflexota bacterium]
MTGAIFTEQLKQSWRNAIYWGFGLGLLVFYVTAAIEDPATIDSYRGLLEALPPAMLSAFGLSSAELLTSAEGFIAFAGFAYGSLALAVYGVLSGLNILSNDEDSGVMNSLLALPVARWQVIIERFLAYAVLLFGIVLMLFGGIVLGSTVFGVEVDMVTMFLGCINMMPAVLSIIAITALISSVFSNKLIVTGISAGFVLVSYVFDVIADAVSANAFADVLGQISVFNYLDAESVIVSGSLQPINVTILLLIAGISIVIAVFAFERRDISG